MFKNFSPVTDYISEINNNKVDYAKVLDLMIQMYNLIKLSDYYQKTSRLCRYYKDDPKGNITDTESFKYKSRLTKNAKHMGIVNAEIAVPLKFVDNFWRTLEISIINFEINLM